MSAKLLLYYAAAGSSFLLEIAIVRESATRIEGITPSDMREDR